MLLAEPASFHSCQASSEVDAPLSAAHAWPLLAVLGGCSEVPTWRRGTPSGEWRALASPVAPRQPRTEPENDGISWPSAAEAAGLSAFCGSWGGGPGASPRGSLCSREPRRSGCHVQAKQGLFAVFGPAPLAARWERAGVCLGDPSSAGQPCPDRRVRLLECGGGRLSKDGPSFIPVARLRKLLRWFSMDFPRCHQGREGPSSLAPPGRCGYRACRCKAMRLLFPSPQLAG